LVGAISAARAVGQHTEWLQRGVQLFKYREELARAEHFGPLMARAIGDLLTPDVIVAVPLHRTRERERGYNQALVLAERLSDAVEVPVVGRGAFVRHSNTPHQTGRSALERRQNMANAFVVERPSEIAGLSVLLVDDVMTSGATMGACASVLRKAGAARIQVVTVTRAINVRL
jgi:ComF family protein